MSRLTCQASRRFPQAQTVKYVMNSDTLWGTIGVRRIRFDCSNNPRKHETMPLPTKVGGHFLLCADCHPRPVPENATRVRYPLMASSCCSFQIRHHLLAKVLGGDSRVDEGVGPFALAEPVLDVMRFEPESNMVSKCHGGAVAGIHLRGDAVEMVMVKPESKYRANSFACESLPTVCRVQNPPDLALTVLLICKPQCDVSYGVPSYSMTSASAAVSPSRSVFDSRSASLSRVASTVHGSSNR